MITLGVGTTSLSSGLPPYFQIKNTVENDVFRNQSTLNNYQVWIIFVLYTSTAVADDACEIIEVEEDSCLSRIHLKDKEQ